MLRNDSESHHINIQELSVASESPKIHPTTVTVLLLRGDSVVDVCFHREIWFDGGAD